MRPEEKRLIERLNTARERGKGKKFHPREAGFIAQTHGAKGLKARTRFFLDWAEAYEETVPLILEMESNVNEADKEFQKVHPGGTAAQYRQFIKALSDFDREELSGCGTNPEVAIDTPVVNRTEEMP